jgi:hypothetical protein
MKLKLIIGIILAALILVAVGALIGKYALNQTPPPITQAPSATSTISPSKTYSPVAAVPKTVTTSPPFTNLPSDSDKVNFGLQITNVSETGILSRSITGEISNTGSVDAHNVICKIEVYSKGKLIKVNSGLSSVIKSLGTINAGKTATTRVDLAFSPVDALTLTQNGVTVNLQISSDEKTQLLTYDYKP